VKGFLKIRLFEKYEKVIYTDTAVITFIVEQIKAIDKKQSKCLFPLFEVHITLSLNSRFPHLFQKKRAPIELECVTK